MAQLTAGPPLVDLAKILMGCWLILWLCMKLVRSVEIQPCYRPKTAGNGQQNTFLGQWDEVRRACAECACVRSVMHVKFQWLARGLWYLVLVPTST